MAMLSAAMEAARTGPGVMPSDCDVAAKLTDPPTYEAHRAEATCMPTQQHCRLDHSNRILLHTPVWHHNRGMHASLAQALRASQSPAGAAMRPAAEEDQLLIAVPTIQICLRMAKVYTSAAHPHTDTERTVAEHPNIRAAWLSQAGRSSIGATDRQGCRQDRSQAAHLPAIRPQP